jgi:hypothetical protein
MMRNRTSGQAAFLTAQLSNKRNWQTLKDPTTITIHCSSSRRQHDLLQPKQEKNTRRDRRWEDHCNNRKIDDKRTTIAAPSFHS